LSRVVKLLAGLFDARLLHAPSGSPEDVCLRRALSRLAAEEVLPGPQDREDLRTPFTALYARPISGTELVLLYELTAGQVAIHAIRPAAW
jgi:hypothetical protein